MSKVTFLLSSIIVALSLIIVSRFFEDSSISTIGNVVLKENIKDKRTKKRQYGGSSNRLESILEMPQNALLNPKVSHIIGNDKDIDLLKRDHASLNLKRSGLSEDDYQALIVFLGQVHDI